MFRAGSPGDTPPPPTSLPGVDEQQFLISFFSRVHKRQRQRKVAATAEQLGREAEGSLGMASGGTLEVE